MLIIINYVVPTTNVFPILNRSTLLQLDPKATNEIGALDAAKFLKKSGLSDVVLSRVWDLSDPSGRGFLTKEGFFVALKLIGLAQEGSEINIKNIYNVLSKPPKVVSSCCGAS